MSRGDGYLMRTLDEILTDEPQSLDCLLDLLTMRVSNRTAFDGRPMSNFDLRRREGLRRAAKRLEREGRVIVETRTTVRRVPREGATQ